MAKGIIFGEIIGVIIVLVIGGILANFVIQYKLAAGSAAAVEKCRLSVVLASYTKTPVASGMEPLTKLDCQRNNIRFEKESQEEINAKVANELYNCVYQSGEGEYDWAKNPWIGINANKNSCMICSTIEFDPKYIKDKNYNTFDSSARFESYLSKGIVKGTALSYADYFASINNKAVPANEKMEVIYLPALEPDKSYAIYFTRLSESTAGKLVDYVGGSQAKTQDFASGLFSSLTFSSSVKSSADIPRSYVFLAPVDTISGCDVVMN